MYEKSNKWRSKKQDEFETGIKIMPEMKTQNIITAETPNLEIEPESDKKGEY